jgi:hypothetical protein
MSIQGIIKHTQRSAHTVSTTTRGLRRLKIEHLQYHQLHGAVPKGKSLCDDEKVNIQDVLQYVDVLLKLGECT